MVRAGLGADWRCLFANDFDPKKGSVYRSNWGSEELQVADIRDLSPADLPGRPDLIWGSFPCQDLSLAGAGAGLRGERSGTFYPFWRIVDGLAASGRAPSIVAIENVCGTLTSHGGKDFEVICRSFADSGFRFGALVINAELFIPQSRPRLFIVGVRSSIHIPDGLVRREPIERFQSSALCRGVDRLPEEVRRRHVMWNLPAPSQRTATFADLIEDDGADLDWHTQAQTKRLLDMMSPVNLQKVEEAQRAGHRVVGGIYRRTRPGDDGRKVQRAEVRFDDVAGCLRTPAGGSSRQTIIIVDGNRVRSRLISARETARLMGLSDSYDLPERYNDAYHLTGDGVAVPVVRFLAASLFEPLLAEPAARRVA